jgi:hypothetical protein
MGTGVETQLPGRWSVHRTGGLLPPLLGVGKQIEGGRGWTTILGVRAARFDVIGLELRYGRPFRGVVDVLTPESPSSFAGRATFRGRTLGTFRMTRKP